jgi:predicted amidohydrolase
MGLMICADAFVPGQVISRALALMGAQIILSPCAWAVAPEHDNLKEPYGQLWVDNYGPVCRESGVWIAGCSNVGRIEVGAWKGHICIGNSIVMNPDGEVARRGVYGESAEELLLIPIQAGPGSRSAGESKVEIHGW